MIDTVLHFVFCPEAQHAPEPKPEPEPEPELRIQTCPVCCETVTEEKLFYMDGWVQHGCSCSCCACEACLLHWIDAQLTKCRNQKALRIPCIGCNKFMPQKMVLTISAPAAVLARQLDYRMALEANKLYPHCMQVECPRAECVGIGFLGFETIMCFVCEHQWPTNSNVPTDVSLMGPLAGGFSCGDNVIAQFDKPERNITFGTRGLVTGPSRGTGADKADRVCVDFGDGKGLLNVLAASQITRAPTSNLWAQDGVGAALASGEAIVFNSAGSELIQIKSCPNCTIGIEKDGGCDHMTCAACRYEFYWSTLKKYR